MKLLTHYINTMAQTHPQIMNWRNNNLNDSLSYSFRSTEYTRENYPSRLHYHDYYELVYFVGGQVCYICGSCVLRPQAGDLILIPPHIPHMSVIDAEETLYSRHVFYFYPDAFNGLGCGSLLDFLSLADCGTYLLNLSTQTGKLLPSLLSGLDEALEKNTDRNRCLALGLLIEIFYWLNEATEKQNFVSEKLPESVRAIQAYIDAHYDSIESVSEIASVFYFSREYVSRLFQRFFHTTVSDYLLQRRVAHSQSMIARGMPLSEVCFRAGFGSMNAFIRGFKKVTHMTPGKYKECL